MRVLSIVGARPQFIKLWPISQAADRAGIDHTVLHTGQHYDASMTDIFFRDFGLPIPTRNLGVGSGPHGKQTGEMLRGIEQALKEDAPDWVVVYGDTNSTLAGALAARKLDIKLAHVEAGLRSWNRSMPEEINRIVSDHCSDLCFAPTASALANLAQEGLADSSLNCGDVMADSVRLAGAVLNTSGAIPQAEDSRFVLATIHRAENTDRRDRLMSLLEQLSLCDLPVMLFEHPRLRSSATRYGLNLARGSISTRQPVDYFTMLDLVRSASVVVTDSGGLQKEAFLLRTPCVTLRQESEWPETLENGWNVLDTSGESLANIASHPAPGPQPSTPFGDGYASDSILQALRERY